MLSSDDFYPTFSDSVQYNALIDDRIRPSSLRIFVEEMLFYWESDLRLGGRPRVGKFDISVGNLTWGPGGGAKKLTEAFDKFLTGASAERLSTTTVMHTPWPRWCGQRHIPHTPEAQD